MYPMYQFPQMPQINSRFVTTIEEAKASMIDGFSTNLYLDTSNGKIYLKKLNNNGMSDFLVYSIEEQKNNDPLAEINSRLTRIENYIGGQNDKSIPSNKQSESVHQPAVAEQDERYDEAEPTGFPKNERNDKWQKRN